MPKSIECAHRKKNKKKTKGVLHAEKHRMCTQKIQHIENTKK